MEMGKLIKMDLTEFLDELASDSPAPGGGSVAALSGALGSALLSMVCNLTLGKESYAAVQDELKKILEKSEQLREKLTKLIDEDTEAFNEVMKAFKMPKETETQKEKRKQVIQQGFKTAAAVPLETARTCAQLLDLAQVVAEKGNKSSITDVAVAALMAKAGIASALLNVKINLGSIKDTTFVEQTLSEIDELERKAHSTTKDIMTIVESSL